MIIPQSSGSAVKSLSKSGQGKLKGDITLSEGANITLTQSGKDIAIAASGGEFDYGDNAPTIDVKCRAYSGSGQLNLSDGVFTLVHLDTENYDIGSDFDHSSTHLFTAPVTGYYLVNANIQFENIVYDKRYWASIYVNGGRTAEACWALTTGDIAQSIHVSDVLYVPATQTIGLYALSQAGANTVDISAGSNLTYMSIHLLSE